MPLVIGTSGWQYRDQRERFYPRGLRQAVFAQEAERAGLHPTRVPAAGEVRAG